MLFNNAGVPLGGSLTENSAEEIERTLDINLKGTFLVCKHALRSMLEKGSGSIVNVASIEGLEGTEGGSGYNASKGGVVLLTKNIAIDAAIGIGFPTYDTARNSGAVTRRRRNRPDTSDSITSTRDG